MNCAAMPLCDGIAATRQYTLSRERSTMPERLLHERSTPNYVLWTELYKQNLKALQDLNIRKFKYDSIHTMMFVCCTY